MMKTQAINFLLKKYLYWRGQDLKGKHLLVYAEPNYGPTFLFMRYLSEIKEKNNTITLMVPPEELAPNKSSRAELPATSVPPSM